MGREIKFRAWDKSGIYTHKGNPGMLQDITGRTFFDQVWHDEDFPKMQYTGLKDKNGKEIYEGDILNTKRGVFEVIWDKYQFALDGFYCSSNDNPSDYFSEQGWDEVIGNIYETPELLKKED